MTPEKLAEYERCYRNWNGTSVMEGAFKELLEEVTRRGALLELADEAIYAVVDGDTPLVCDPCAVKYFKARAISRRGFRGRAR